MWPWRASPDPPAPLLCARTPLDPDSTEEEQPGSSEKSNNRGCPPPPLILGGGGPLASTHGASGAGLGLCATPPHATIRPCIVPTPALVLALGTQGQPCALLSCAAATAASQRGFLARGGQKWQLQPLLRPFPLCAPPVAVHGATQGPASSCSLACPSPAAAAAEGMRDCVAAPLRLSPPPPPACPSSTRHTQAGSAAPPNPDVEELK